MTIEEHNKITAEILANLSDQAKVSENLAKLKDDYGQTLATMTKSSDEAASLKADNENLRATNMKLFLQIGQPAANTAKQGNDPDDDKKLTYESLFNEKGELK